MGLESALFVVDQSIMSEPYHMRFFFMLNLLYSDGFSHTH